MQHTPFRFLRFAFVIASFTPLFLLLGIKGNSYLTDKDLWWIVAPVVFLPNFLLYLRWRLVQKDGQTFELQIRDSVDNRESLVIYLLAVLLALYGVTPENGREWAAYGLTILFVILLFWMANLHHLNVIFNLAGYRTYTVTFDVFGANGMRSNKAVLLSKRLQPPTSGPILCYRLSHDVFIEKSSHEI